MTTAKNTIKEGDNNFLRPVIRATSKRVAKEYQANLEIHTIHQIHEAVVINKEGEVAAAGILLIKTAFPTQVSRLTDKIQVVAIKTITINRGLISEAIIVHKDIKADRQTLIKEDHQTPIKDNKIKLIQISLKDPAITEPLPATNQIDIRITMAIETPIHNIKEIEMVKLKATVLTEAKIVEMVQLIAMATRSIVKIPLKEDHPQEALTPIQATINVVRQVIRINNRKEDNPIHTTTIEIHTIEKCTLLLLTLRL